MSLEWAAAKRYLWSKRRHPFVGVTGAVSVLGIAVGVAALVTVLAVMNGFDEELKDRIIGLRAHLIVEKEKGPFLEHARAMKVVAAIPDVQAVAPYVEGQALAQNGAWGTGVLVRGVVPELEKRVSKIEGFVIRGTFTGAPGKAALGSELAKRLGLAVGGRFQILTQNTDKPVELSVEALFSSGMYDFDANLLFVGLSESQKMYAMGGSVSGLSVALRSPERADAAKEPIRRKLGYEYSARSWMDLNRTLFGALKLEKIVMFLILALIILVACLNIAGSLTILVMNKTKDIGVLKALGATQGQIVRIFVLDGLLIGLTGVGAGLAAGILLSWAVGTYPIVALPEEIYYIDRLPVKMRLLDTAWVAVTGLALSLLSAFYPAWTAGRLDTVKALRYE